METTEGFYKLEENNWIYAPTFVCAPNYELSKELKDTYTYPIDGWSWYDESPIVEEIVLIEEIVTL